MLPLRHAVPIVLLLSAAGLRAQELAPRAYWPAPTGTRLISIGYVHSAGDVLLDKALPIDDVDAETHGLSLNYLQFFSLAGRTASFTLEVPSARSDFDFAVMGQTGNRELSGLGDPRLRLAVNLHGAPAMTRSEFQAFRKSPGDVFGASLRIVLPTGSYDSDRLANIGANRWAFKPELGYLHPFGQWVLEIDAGVWLYTSNDDFLGGTLRQDPLFSAELHLVRELGRGLWTSVDLNGFYGGRTTVDGSESDNRQQNSRIGLTFVYPFAKRHALKVAISTGLTTRSGGDFDTAILAYSLAV